MRGCAAGSRRSTAWTRPTCCSTDRPAAGTTSSPKTGCTSSSSAVDARLTSIESRRDVDRRSPAFAGVRDSCADVEADRGNDRTARGARSRDQALTARHDRRELAGTGSSTQRRSRSRNSSSSIAASSASFSDLGPSRGSRGAASTSSRSVRGAEACEIWCGPDRCRRSRESGSSTSPTTSRPRWPRCTWVISVPTSIKVDPDGGQRAAATSPGTWPGIATSGVVVLDLSDPADLAVAKRLIADADVAMFDAPPGALERLGLDGATLTRGARAADPRVGAAVRRDGPLELVAGRRTTFSPR